MSRHRIHSFVVRNQAWVLLFLFVCLFSVLFLNFLLFLCEIRIIHSNLFPLPGPLYVPSALVTFPAKKWNKIKFKRKFNLIMEAAVWLSESHSIIFSPYIFICRGSLQGVVGLVRDLWLLLHYKYWDSSWIFCCPVSRRSCSVGSAEQVLSCAPAVHRWSGC